MVTTLRMGNLRVAIMMLSLVFMCAVVVLTAQPRSEDNRKLETRLEISAEKISSLEEWRRAIEGMQIAPRLATLESQMETSTWLQRAMLGGIGALVLEMLVRLVSKQQRKDP